AQRHAGSFPPVRGIRFALAWSRSRFRPFLSPRLHNRPGRQEGLQRTGPSMNKFGCRCGNPLFFENTLCVKCGMAVGYCPHCERIVSLVPTDNGGLMCGREECGVPLLKCHNYAVEQVCNCCVQVSSESDVTSVTTASVEDSSPLLCRFCQLTEVIPDLT